MSAAFAGVAALVLVEDRVAEVPLRPGRVARAGLESLSLGIIMVPAGRNHAGLRLMPSLAMA